MLLRGAEDRRIQDFFIEQAFPRREAVDAGARADRGAGEDGATTPELTAEVNLGRGRLEAMLKVLDVEGAVARAGSRWVRGPAATGATTPSATRGSPSCAATSRRAMAAFGADGRCLMRVLQEELDDPDRRRLRALRGLRGPRFDGTLDPALVREAALLLRSRRSCSTSRRWPRTPTAR